LPTILKLRFIFSKIFTRISLERVVLQSERWVICILGVTIDVMHWSSSINHGRASPTIGLTILHLTLHEKMCWGSKKWNHDQYFNFSCYCVDFVCTVQGFSHV